MIVTVIGMIMSVLALCFAIPSASYAEHQYEVTVTIGDTTIPGTSGQPTLIAGTYSHAATGGQITITNVGTGGAQAKVEVTNGTSDSSSDSIRLINARITANNASVTNFPITFKRRMIEGPNTPPSNLYYKMYAKGLFQQATGSSIYLGWFVKHPMTSGFLFLDSKSYTPGSTSFTISPAGKIWPTPPEMDDDRVLKVEFTVKLANGRWLDFDTTVAQPRMIKLYSSPSPDESACDLADLTCNEDENPSLYLPYQFEAEKCVAHDKKCDLTSPNRPYKPAERH
jgi:hypothetical protein